MEINERDAVLKKCSRCAVYNHKGKRLTEARVVHTNNKISLFSPNMGFQTDALKHEWIFLMKDAG